MLNQPFVGGILQYEKKETLPREAAYIQKAANIQDKNSRPAINLMKRALK